VLKESTVTVLYQWTLHLSDPDQEWEARCGELEPPMLVDQVPEKPLVGYRPCPRCQVVLMQGTKL